MTKTKMNFTNVNTIESKAVLCVSVIMFACAVSFVNKFFFNVLFAIL